MPTETTETTPTTKWQALRERWAWAREKLAAWWTGPGRWNDASGKHLFVAILAALVAMAILVFGLLRVDSAPAPASAVAVVPLATSAAAAPAELEQRVSALEAAIARQEGPGPTPARPIQAPRAALRAPAPLAQPQVEQAPAWGETDLDRAIANFNPPASPFGAKQ